MVSGLCMVLCWLAEKPELGPSSPASHSGLVLSWWIGRVTMYIGEEARPRHSCVLLSSGALSGSRRYDSVSSLHLLFVFVFVFRLLPKRIHCNIRRQPKNK